MVFANVSGPLSFTATGPSIPDEGFAIHPSPSQDGTSPAIFSTYPSEWQILRWERYLHHQKNAIILSSPREALIHLTATILWRS